MDTQIVALIKATKSEELLNKLIELLRDKKITIEQLIEADKNKQITITEDLFNLLGVSFHAGNNGVKETNNGWAIKLCEYAAFKGHDVAKTNCAFFYLYKHQGEPDLDKALQYCLEAKEDNQNRAQLLTRIHLKRREYEAARSAFNGFEPVKSEVYINLLIELCEELTQDSNWQFACDIETKLTIETVNIQQKEKIAKLLERLEGKLLQSKENETELQKIIQNIAHVAGKFSHIDDSDIKAICNKILSPDDKTLYKLFIDSLYVDLAQKSKASKELTHSIDQSSTQTLSGGKYVGELIQNAHDAAKSDKLQVNFFLTDKHLIFGHNGKYFSLRDIQGLCSYASPDRDKAESDGTIGEKGIGFKSVFNIADDVTVLSGSAGFSFRRAHPKWQYDSNNYPWQITPIWTEKEKVTDAFLDSCKVDDDVIFIFKIKNPEIRQEIAGHLKALVNDSSMLLFLNNLTAIRFVDKQANMDIALQKELLDGGQHCVVKKNNEVFSEWLLFKYNYDLSQTEKNTLSSKKDIAVKYRQRKSAILQFATPIDVATIEANIKQNKLFCYFPTEVKLNFPFLVSAPFLLNSERAQLLDSTGAKYWNELLVAEIARAQFIWFQQLAQTEQFWRHPISLIAEPSLIAFPDRIPNAKAIFKQRFEEALKNKKFLRALFGNELISVDSKMDIYGFVAKFGDELTKQSCISSAYLAKYQDKLKSLGATEFDAKCIVQQLTAENFKQKLATPEVNRQICEFFYSLNNKAVNAELKSVAFILSQNNELKKPGEVCEPSDRLRYAITDFDIKLSLLHPLIDGLFRDNVQEKQVVKKRQAWLRDLGVKKLSVQEIVAAVNAAKDREITIQFLVRVSQRFQPVANESQKTAEKRKKELNELRELKLNTIAADGRKIPTPINRFYLSDDFNPVLLLQSKLPKLPAYLSANEFDKNLSTALLSQYKTLLLSLGVSETVTSENVGRLWDSMIDDESKFIFTKLLFTIFYSEDDLEKISQFSELAIALKDKITFETTLGKFVGSDKCYLADAYKPEFEIEKYANGIHFVSEKYIDKAGDPENILRWHKFLVELGVCDNIRISKDKKTYSSTDSYFKFLWNYQAYTAEGKLSGDMPDNSLFPYETGRYSYQHSVSLYVEIQFIDQLLFSPFFWQIIVKKWNFIYPDCRNVIYSTQRSSRKVISNIEYLALQSLKRAQGTEIDSLDKLYAPSLQEIVAPVGLKVANVGIELTAEQNEFFGFKTKLMAEDALKVLLHLQTQPVDENLLKKLALVYQHLANCPKNCLHEQDLSHLCLLNESNQFLSIQQLHAFLVAEKHVPRYTENPALVKKPHHVSLREFKVVCRILGVKTINKASLDLQYELNNEAHHSIATSLDNSVTLLALLVILKEQGIDHVTDEYIQTQLVRLKRKIDGLVCSPADKLTVSYSDIFRLDLRAWLKDDTLYYKAGLDRGTQNAICQQLLDYLNLPIDLSELATVLFDDTNAWLAERGDKISALHQRIVTGLTCAQEAENKKKRIRPETESVEHTTQKQSLMAANSLGTQTVIENQQEDENIKESPAKRIKYSEVTTEALSSLPPAASPTLAPELTPTTSTPVLLPVLAPAIRETIISIGDTFEERGSKIEETAATKALEPHKKRTFTEAGLDAEAVPGDDKLEKSEAKRVKLHDTAANSSNVAFQIAMIPSSATVHSNTPLESSVQKPDLMEVDKSEENKSVRVNTEVTNSPIVTSSSAVSGRVVSQSFFGSQSGMLEESTSTTAPVRKNRTAAQERADKQQGLSAEKHVFEKLKAKYSSVQEKYQDFVETNDGFKVTVTKKEENGSQITVTKLLIWHNKHGETYQNVDMTFTTYDSSQKVIKKQAIEVKSSAGTNVQQGIFGEPEMKVLNTEENYIIWHVGNISNTEQIFDRKIKNPKQLIETGEITKREESVVKIKTILDFSAIYTKSAESIDGSKKSSQASNYVAKPHL